MAPQRDERDRLHEALIDLCFERGFQNFGLGALLSRAGVDRPSFERHFVDLEDCFLKIFEAEMDRYRCEFAPVAGECADWRERVRVTLYALFRFLVADERRARFIVVESRVAGERARVFADQRIETLFDLIDAGRSELDDPDSISRTTAEAVGGGILNQVYAAVARGVPLPPERELVPELMYCVVLPYAGLDAALEELYIPPPSSRVRPRPLGAHRG
ncbi:MAG TPA: TetR/AcrR family transcriptional regulator [Solirubrobacterales bacterium]